MPNRDGTGRLGRGNNCDEEAQADRVRDNEDKRTRQGRGQRRGKQEKGKDKIIL